MTLIKLLTRKISLREIKYTILFLPTFFAFSVRSQSKFFFACPVFNSKMLEMSDSIRAITEPFPGLTFLADSNVIFAISDGKILNIRKLSNEKTAIVFFCKNEGITIEYNYFSSLNDTSKLEYKSGEKMGKIAGTGNKGNYLLYIRVLEFAGIGKRDLRERFRNCLPN